MTGFRTFRSRRQRMVAVNTLTLLIGGVVLFMPKLDLAIMPDLTPWVPAIVSFWEPAGF